MPCGFPMKDSSPSSEGANPRYEMATELLRVAGDTAIGTNCRSEKVLLDEISSLNATLL